MSAAPLANGKGVPVPGRTRPGAQPARARAARIADVVRRTLDALRLAGCAPRAAGMAGYFKAYESLQFFGVDTPTVRRLAARVRREDGRDWTLRDGVTFAEAMISRPQLEAKVAGACVLGRFRAAFTPALLPVTERWLARHCTDWASTDNLCGEVIGPLIASRPELAAELRAWRVSPHLYVRRASAVALIPAVRRGVALDDAYDAARALGGEDHHLLQKAAGWLLREAGKIDGVRLESFLRKHGPRLSRTTVSYAIERFAPDVRRDLLVATRQRS